jgi:hypothetical protein
MFTRKYSASTPAHAVWTFLPVALFTVSLLTGLPARGASASPNQELVTITAPIQERDYNLGQVEAQFLLSRLADPKTLTVVLNGRDLTKRFHGADNPWGSLGSRPHCSPPMGSGWAAIL